MEDGKRGMNPAAAVAIVIHSVLDAIAIPSPPPDTAHHSLTLQLESLSSTRPDSITISWIPTHLPNLLAGLVPTWKERITALSSLNDFQSLTLEYVSYFGCRNILQTIFDSVPFQWLPLCKQTIPDPTLTKHETDLYANLSISFISYCVSRCLQGQCLHQHSHSPLQCLEAFQANIVLSQKASKPHTIYLFRRDSAANQHKMLGLSSWGSFKIGSDMSMPVAAFQPCE